MIKSYSEDDVHKSIKYGVWASTDTGNRRLDTAYRDMGNRGPIYLFFSVNASGQFSGMAQMESELDYRKKFGSWGQDKWNGSFQIRWTFIKDIPNNQFRHIVLANNDNKPVTNSRDTQEIMPEQGREMLRIFHTFKSRTSILDDFSFYDKRQELLEARLAAQLPNGIGMQSVTNSAPLMGGVGAMPSPFDPSSIAFDGSHLGSTPMGVSSSPAAGGLLAPRQSQSLDVPGGHVGVPSSTAVPGSLYHSMGQVQQSDSMPSLSGDKGHTSCDPFVRFVSNIPL